MAEYIEREAVKKSICRYCRDIAPENCNHKNECNVVCRIDSIPAADVRPVVRGKWELDSDPGEPWRYVCNICGDKTKDTVMGKPRANFCPNCGAMMEESNEKA